MGQFLLLIVIAFVGALFSFSVFRPLSMRAPLHLVLKADRKNLRRGYRSPLDFAICNDHIHLLVRFSKRSLGQHFLRVVAGQIAQQFEKNGFLVTDTQSVWKLRPFSRVIQGWRPYLMVKNYVRLNEKEAGGVIQYNKQRLKGLSSSKWELLWS